MSAIPPLSGDKRTLRSHLAGAINTRGMTHPEFRAMQLAYDKAADIEKKATVKLRKIQPTTIAGVAAVTAYFVEYIDHYPDCPWITDPKNWDDPCWFEHALIRNLAAAMAQINRAPA
jgi:hypothetical protein